MLEGLVILTDADNTLWDTNTIFTRAQLLMLELVETAVGSTLPYPHRLRWLRGYDEAIAQVHPHHFRYPPKLLVQALALGLSGSDPKEAANAALAGASGAVYEEKADNIVYRYNKKIEAQPDLLPGVIEGLTYARNAGVDVHVLTESQADLQRTRVLGCGVTDLIKDLAEVTKTVEEFDRQRRRFAPKLVCVVGDQPDRDIAPARAAGCLAVLVPSRFRPTWHTDDAWVTADHIAQDFEKAITWVIANARVR